MSRKLIFISYFVMSSWIFFFANVLYSKLTDYQHASLLYGYQRQPILIALVGMAALFFDYVSIALPREELHEVQIFLKIRSPDRRAIWREYSRFALPYFIFYALFQNLAWPFQATFKTATWMIIMVVIWWCLLFCPHVKSKGLNGWLVFSVFAVMRIIGFYSY